ncbi:PPR: pentatricopeptide repeat domain containing protein [Nitzschia inconspicua]|uniref:PPR: pentatricopeptide repeat domain containing protein n=1 Tax=Nitzschia inconspicua TaxID=303405 RepID=A0A9K3LHL7_9STRA|nr:PPR: pentatricopeptide repeat domain containing protein [Nitzschia inconspicua]
MRQQKRIRERSTQATHGWWHCSMMTMMLLFLTVWISPCRGFMGSKRTSNHQYISGARLEIISSQRQHHHQQSTCWSPLISKRFLSPSTDGIPSTLPQPTNTKELKTDVFRLCDNGQINLAMKVLENFVVNECDETEASNDATIQEVFRIVRAFLQALINDGKHSEDTLQRSSKLLDVFIKRGQKVPEWLPTADMFASVIKSWTTATPSVPGASVECTALLKKIWSLYRQEEKRQKESNGINRDILQRFVPDRDTYFAAIRSCSMRDRGVDAAKRADALLDDMEALREEFPQLTPDRTIVNEVMNAWSKSGLPYRAGKRCETLLNRMISMARNDNRLRLTPTTVSFNIAIAALAQGKERDSGSRAEALLFKMEDLNSSHGWDCAPDLISFNSVINNWASSRSPNAAQRVTEIMKHMIKRYEIGASTVSPDNATYSVILKALAKSRDKYAINQAEEIFQEYRDGVESGKWGLFHSALTWNSMIHCYAKSRRPDAGKKALRLFKTMRANHGKPGWELCCADTYTYTSVIDAIAKDESMEASQEAIRLLEEIEEVYAETNDQLVEPNILLYTAVVNAVGRSHKEPDRAQKIVDRLETKYLQFIETGGRRSPKPDTLFYNALINAYGWSDVKSRSKKSFAVLQHMIHLYQSGDLREAKPDIISYNSVLNACAHESTETQAERDEIMKIVTEIYEDLTSRTKGCGFARPKQTTYAQVLMAISNHMPSDDDKKALMGEAVFFKCAEDGLVYPQVVFMIHQILPKARFREIMGEAINMELYDAGKLGFDVTRLPWEWTVNAQEYGKKPTATSRRKTNDFQENKKAIRKTPTKQQTEAYR